MNKMLRNEFNQRGERVVHGKLQNIAERNQRLKNGNTFHVCGMEDLVFLKCPHYTHKAVYRFNTISKKSQYHFLRNRKIHAKIHM